MPMVLASTSPLRVLGLAWVAVTTVMSTNEMVSHFLEFSIQFPIGNVRRTTKSDHRFRVKALLFAGLTQIEVISDERLESGTVGHALATTIAGDSLMSELLMGGRNEGIGEHARSGLFLRRSLSTEHFLKELASSLKNNALAGFLESLVDHTLDLISHFVGQSRGN